MSIVQQILQIYTLRRSPKDIAYHPPAALLLFFVAIALSTIHLSKTPIFYFPTLASASLLAVGVSIDFLILKIHNKANRFVQMTTASLGIACLTTIILIIATNVKELTLPAFVAQLWGFYLAIIILRDALECSFIKSLLITIAAYLVSASFMINLFLDVDAFKVLQAQSMAELQQTTEQIKAQ
ncbi:hypothetical protein [Arenicella xantha]|uniref:Uncharacterized protein n=1 Tax=Arenicella xantha TaxID=644221 RepID=A0A395JMH0_9GAMM|nr:hypothetical protein [Arenicella xantha]RBP50848.1 hypothetical protein DFR28_102264 [Arenicella xantha]